MMFGIPNFKDFIWFYQAFLQFSSTEKWRSVIYYRKSYSKRNKKYFIKTETFSLKRVVSVDVWTSYSTNSEYYFPLTAPRIWSPYVKGNYHFGWDEGAKTMPKSHQMTWYLYCCTTSCSFWLKSIVFGMVLRPSSQPKWYFPSSYGLHILGTVRGN